METNCPHCRQRLSYPGLLKNKNPLLRCSRCRTTFRPSEVDSPPGSDVRPRSGPVPGTPQAGVSQAGVSQAESWKEPWEEAASNERRPNPPAHKDLWVAPPAEDLHRYFTPRPVPPEPIQTETPELEKEETSSASGSKPGWLRGGSAWIVIGVLLLKAGPKLLKEIFKERPAPPPVQRPR